MGRAAWLITHWLARQFAQGMPLSRLAPVHGVPALPSVLQYLILCLLVTAVVWFAKVFAKERTALLPVAAQKTP